MRNLKRVFVSFAAALLFVCSALFVVGCAEKRPEPPVSVQVRIQGANKTIVAGEPLDCKTLFTLTVDGESVAVTDEMLDLGSFTANDPAVGEYTIKLTYSATDGKNYSASAKITVTKKPVIVELSSTDRAIVAGEPLDCKTLFTLTVDGESVAVTDKMLDLGSFTANDPAVGEYTIQLTYSATDGKSYSASAKITVTHKPVEVSVSSMVKEIKEGEPFDCKTLFTLTVDGKKEQITDEMLDLGKFSPNKPVAGTYEIKFDYTAADGKSYSKTATVTVVKKPVAVELSSENKTIEEGTPLDCKTLFTLTVNGKQTEITQDMLVLGEFSPSNPVAGIYEITLNYSASDGKIYTATASVTVTKKSVEVFISGAVKEIEEGTPLDCKTLFTLTVDGTQAEITDDMLVLGEFSPSNPAVGVYEITLNYTASDGKPYSKTTTVTVTRKPIVVEIASESKTVEAGTPVDCKTLFTLTVNGKSVEITNDMLDLGTFVPDNPSAGEYSIRLNYTAEDGKSYSATVKVTVTGKVTKPCVVEIKATSGEADAGKKYDPKQLFTLTVDGKKIAVTDDMLDLDGLNPNSVKWKKGGYNIKLTYTAPDGVTYTETANLEVQIWIGPY